MCVFVRVWELYLSDISFWSLQSGGSYCCQIFYVVAGQENSISSSCTARENLFSHRHSIEIPPAVYNAFTFYIPWTNWLSIFFISEISPVFHKLFHKFTEAAMFVWIFLVTLGSYGLGRVYHFRCRPAQPLY